MRCEHCEKTIRRNQKNISCYICFGNFHIKCIGVKDLSPVTDWTCLKRSLSVLPFYGCSLEMEDEVYCTQNGHSQDEMSEEALRVLQERHNQLKLTHLNTQCMTSTFDKFLLTVNKYPVDIITLSETWLKDNAALLDYVLFLDMFQFFGTANRLKAAVLERTSRNQSNSKLWIEIPGHNKHSKTLIGLSTLNLYLDISQ